MADRFRAALCETCWNRLHPERRVSPSAAGAAEVCDECNNATRSGIYVRRARPPVIWKKGQHVQITMGGRTVLGVVELVSPNGKSLALTFEAILCGYAGMIPASWDADGATYVGLCCGKPVALAPKPVRVQ